MFDVVITGGRLVDGSGRPAAAGDLAIENGRIVAIGGRIGGAARRRIDADGAIVTPGFVDVHSHYDGQVTWDDKIDPSFSNGVTTTVMGNCGVGFAPAKPEDRDLLISVMEGVEAIPGIVLKEGVPWKWQSFPEYLDFLGQRRFGVDVATLIGHAPLRVFAMGERAARHEQATADDLAVMAQCVREAMAAGALGLSSGRITEHMYGTDFAIVPGTFAEHEELLTLSRAMAESGRGMFQIVPRGTVGSFMGGQGLTREERAAEHSLFDDIARASGRPVHYLLQQFDSDPEDWRMMLSATARARAQGLSIHAHIAARGFGMLSTLEGYHNFMVRPAYLEIAALPPAQRAARMRDPEVRARILADTDLPPEQCPDFTTWGMVQALNMRAPVGFLFDDDHVDYEPAPDQAIGAIAARTAREPIEVIYDHLAAGDGGNIVAQMFFNYAGGNLDHAYEMLQDAGTLASLGDGGAHMRLISDASMLPYTLSFWTRDRQRGPRLPLEATVAKITRDNARAYGFSDRGELALGKRADINVIDYDAMKVELPQMVHDLPAGGARLNQRTTGFLATLLNGTVTRERDEDTGERPGRLVRANQIA